jgi:hypothetical protein
MICSRWPTRATVASSSGNWCFRAAAAIALPLVFDPLLEVRIANCLLDHQVHRPAKQLFQFVLQRKEGICVLHRRQFVEDYDEVEVAALGIEVRPNGRAKQVEPADMQPLAQGVDRRALLGDEVRQLPDPDSTLQADLRCKDRHKPRIGVLANQGLARWPSGIRRDTVGHNPRNGLTLQREVDTEALPLVLYPLRILRESLAAGKPDLTHCHGSETTTCRAAASPAVRIVLMGRCCSLRVHSPVRPA